MTNGGRSVTHRLAFVRRLVAAAFAAAGLVTIAAGSAGAASPGSVVVLPATGVVDSSLESTITNALDQAAADGDAALVIKLDTPGGELTATQSIVGAILDAKVPVIVWVAPAGGYAASAGTFISLSANLLYMAPGTRIGAASPIDANGQDIPGTLGDKVRNDAIAFISSIAETRGRPVDWAASTVRDARSSSAQEAVSLGVADGMAATIEEVIRQANGKVVKVQGNDVTLDLTGAPVVEGSVNPLDRLVNLLADPNIAFLLFVVGALLLLFEFQNPSILAGIVGVVAIILSFVGFANLPTNVVGLVLVGIGLALFALEPFIVSHGLLTLGGLVAFIVGGSILYNAAGPLGPQVRVAVPILVVAGIAAAGFGILVTAVAIRIRKLAPPSSVQPASVPVGTIGQVQRPLTPLGSIRAVGEEWSARSADEQPLERGTPVRVVASDGLTVVVEPAPGALP